MTNNTDTDQQIFALVKNRELLSIKVADKIEEVIHSGKIKIGEKLPTEIVLCKQFGVSRTAIREALRMLSAKGFISIEKRKGIFVRGLKAQDVTDPMHYYLKTHIGAYYILDIIEARTFYEPEIAKVAAINRTEEDLNKLRKDLKSMKSFMSSPVEWARLDMNFHLHIAVATQNVLLPLMMKPVFRLMPEIKSKIIFDVPEARESAIEWHSKILQSIIEGKPDLAYTLMKDHLLIAREHAEKMMKIEGLLEAKNEKGS